MKNKAELVVYAISENIGLARIATATFASQINFTLAEIEEIKVAISEAVSNSIIHAYENNEGEVKIKMAIEEGSLTLIIIDEGKGIEDVKQVCEPAYSNSNGSERMGLGLSFIDSFMDSFELKSELGVGTTLKMLKKPAVGND